MGPHELDVVVARYAQRAAFLRAVDDKPNNLGHPGSAIDEVADEEHPSALRMGPRAGGAGVGISQFVQKGGQLVVAAVHVTDNVKRPAVMTAVVPERGALDGRSFDRIGGIEHEYVAEALALQTAERASKLGILLTHHVRTERAVGPLAIAFVAEIVRQTEDDGDRQAVVLPGECNQRRAGFRLHIGRIDDSQFRQRQPLRRNGMQHAERLVRYGLIILVIANQPAAVVR